MKTDTFDNRTKKIIELHIKKQIRALFAKYSEKVLLNHLIIQPGESCDDNLVRRADEVYKLFSEYLSLSEENLLISPSKVSFKSSLTPEYCFSVYRLPNQDDAVNQFLYAINEVKWIDT